MAGMVTQPEAVTSDLITDPEASENLISTNAAHETHYICITWHQALEPGSRA